MSLPLARIDDKYEIVAKIKEGGMGAIYKVRHRLLDEIRVVKVLHPELGHRTLSNWKLPSEICEVALHHEELAIGGGNPYLLLVQAAIPIGRMLEQHPDYDPDLNPLDTTAVELLELTDLEVATLTVDLEDEFETFKGMF